MIETATAKPSKRRPIPRECAQCFEPFTALSSRARYCSNRCRQRAKVARQAHRETLDPEIAPTLESLEAVVTSARESVLHDALVSQRDVDEIAELAGRLQRLAKH